MARQASRRRGEQTELLGNCTVDDKCGSRCDGFCSEYDNGFGGSMCYCECNCPSGPGWKTKRYGKTPSLTARTRFLRVRVTRLTPLRAAALLSRAGLPVAIPGKSIDARPVSKSFKNVTAAVLAKSLGLVLLTKAQGA